MQLPGNYARELLNPRNNYLLPGFFSDQEEQKKVLVSEIQQKYIILREAYRATKPLPQQIASYKTKAVALGRFLLTEIPWAHWPNYLHRTIEHVQEIMMKKGSIGALSAEGSEANNKQTRMYRSLRSRTDSPFNSMTDVLQLGWLVGSKVLQKLASVSIRKYQCSNCGESGHSKRTCLINPSEDSVGSELTNYE